MKNCIKCNHRFTFKDRLKSILNLRGNLKCRACKAIYKPKSNIYRAIYVGIVTFIMMMIFFDINISNNTLKWGIYMVTIFPIYLLFDVLPHRFHRYEL
ncbi:MAG: hypothetical protein ACRCXT_06650, partial [Paraclostridium sp.]